MYRIVSPTAILGYGFPEHSFRKALEGNVDLIAVDAGSMDAGPYYLGAKKPYVGEAAIRRDLQLLIKAALAKNCRLIIGSAGFSGGDTQLRETVCLIRELLETMDPGFVRLAVIPSGVPASVLKPVKTELVALGHMPELNDAILEESEVVGQMGVEPIISAIQEGAQIIICGRAYDPAIFAADPIHRGYDEGICYHAAKVLECGAIACEPGSGSDCLVAEIRKDGSASFYAPNALRKATVKSIAAHTLYEKSRPDLFSLPGGILDIRHTTFEQINESTVFIRGTEFHSQPYSIKLEGSRSIGKRSVSILPLKTCEGLGDDLRVYGRNGVEATPVKEPIQEIGLVVVARHEDLRSSKDALAFLRSTILHYGYEGRISTAGNVAFPFSPSDLSFENEGGGFTTCFIAGTRDPIFQFQFEQIKDHALEALRSQHPALYVESEIEFILGDSNHPIALLETIEASDSLAVERHREREARYKDRLDLSRPCFSSVDAGNAYEWSVHHLLGDRALIENLFPVELCEYKDGDWSVVSRRSTDFSRNFDRESSFEFTNAAAEDTSCESFDSNRTAPLSELANVIRSKNAGINEITFDILFSSETYYRMALASGVFSAVSLIEIMAVPEENFLGVYSYDPAWAIKFTLRRQLLCGSPGERDTFGAQQHTRLLGLKIPV